VSTRRYSAVPLGYSRALLLRQGRRARCVPWCAGAYVSGADGSNECPAGSVRIVTERACRTAVAAAGKTVSASTLFPFVETRSYYPRGCYYNIYNLAYFNADAVGAGISDNKLLCAVTNGAPRPNRNRYSQGTHMNGTRIMGTRRALANGTHRVLKGSRSSREGASGSGGHIYVCVHTHTHIYIYIHVNICKHAHAHTHTHTRTHAHTHTHTHTHTHIFHIHIFVHVCIYICTYIYVCVCVCVYTHTHTHIYVCVCVCVHKHTHTHTYIYTYV
jgi:hypothetical protein